MLNLITAHYNIIPCRNLAIGISGMLLSPDNSFFILSIFVIKLQLWQVKIHSHYFNLTVPVKLQFAPKKWHHDTPTGELVTFFYIFIT